MNILVISIFIDNFIIIKYKILTNLNFFNYTIYYQLGINI